ncbi:MAG: hypothetical protein CML03_01000 [Pseudooceanicola sp.]|nr:hypothetical protein [Pseudooceanicola sp.]|tara:strand:+ start:1679 stop:2323 length:645 start_codon:yes stop_codon:yes gene_type:complete
MQVIKCPQGSVEWLEARTGAITASMFEECCKRLKSGPNKGDFSAAAKDYALKLAIERISGSLLQEDKFETFEMRRGHELEPEARLLHEEKTGLFIEQTGFVISDCGHYGASVDGMINDDGMSEYKCFISPKSLRHILFDNDIDSVMPQIQGGMWVTGRQWAHFVLYCPALADCGKALKIIDVKRDETYIEEMKAGLLEFNNLVESYKDKLNQAA